MLEQALQTERMCVVAGVHITLKGQTAQQAAMHAKMKAISYTRKNPKPMKLYSFILIAPSFTNICIVWSCSGVESTRPQTAVHGWLRSPDNETVKKSVRIN